MVRFIVSLVSGVAVGGLVVALLQTIARNMYPLSLGLTDDQTTQALSQMPIGFYWFLIASHFVGAFGAGLVTSLINKKYRVRLGLLATGVILILTFISNYHSPYPDWAKVTDVTLTIAAGVIGSRLGASKPV